MQEAYFSILIVLKFIYRNCLDVPKSHTTCQPLIESIMAAAAVLVKFILTDLSHCEESDGSNFMFAGLILNAPL